MKAIRTLLFALLLTTGLRAQYFEGTIRYEVEVTGEQAQQFAAFMPSYIEYTYGEESVRVRSDAAMMNDLLLRNDEGSAYVMMPSQKRAMRIRSDDEGAARAKENIKIEETDERRVIAGHNTRKYLVTMKDPVGGMTQNQEIWATTDLKVRKPEGSAAAGANLLLDGIDGVPLQFTTSSTMFTMRVTAGELKPGKPDAAELRVPADYTVEDFDPTKILGGGR
ncbi:MAG: hypothetical protein WBA12_02160 [Catalinimonas sp.]